jgi:hypothetical protein
MRISVARQSQIQEKSRRNSWLDSLTLSKGKIHKVDMTFTYTGPNTAAEKVRYHIQDTDSGRPLLTDAEIAYELAEAGNNVLQAALACAETLVAKGAHRVTKKIGPRTINYSDLTSQYRALAATLQERIQRGNLGYTAPEMGKVADSTNYPKEFENTDVSGPGWDDSD